MLRWLERAGVQGECGPKLAPEVDPAVWLAKPGAPKPLLAEEKPPGETLQYEELIQAWREGRACSVEDALLSVGGKPPHYRQGGVRRERFDPATAVVPGFGLWEETR